MFKLESKLNVWLFCRLARDGVKNGWLMGFLAVCIVAEPSTFWWRVPLLFLVFTLIATAVVRFAPEANSDGDKDWAELIAAKRRRIENNVTQDVTEGKEGEPFSPNKD